MVDRFLPALRSQSSSTRQRGARDLRKYVEAESRDLSHGAYMKWVRDISARLMALCNGHDAADRIGGITAMDELVELFIAERNDQTIIEFAHSLTKVFEKIPAADAATLRLAAKALGHIVSTGGTSLIEFVEEYHVSPALEWLKNETFHVRRHAAVMILKELSINAPSTAFRYMDKYFDFIWSAFWDSKLIVRVSASESLQNCLSLIQQRESNRKIAWYTRALDEVEASLKKLNPDAIHGALLIINELLRNTGDFMHPHYGQTCQWIFQFQEHKNTQVRCAVINLYPRLAKFNTSAFIERGYRKSMMHLLEVLHSQTVATRSDALLSVGKLALAIGPSLANDDNAMPGIMSGIKIGLEVRKKSDLDTHKEALACLRMMAEALGQLLSKFDLDSMIKELFKNDLDVALVETLTTMSKRIPSQTHLIQQQLFSRIVGILTVHRPGVDNNTFSSTGSSPPSRARSTTKGSSSTTNTSIKSLISIPHSIAQVFSNGASSGYAGATIIDTSNNNSSSNLISPAEVAASNALAMQVLALNTLANFDFQGNRHIAIRQFVHDMVVKFLEHDYSAIRKAAAITCCKLLLPSSDDLRGNGGVVPPIGASYSVLRSPTKTNNEVLSRPVAGVVERLLTVGIADTEPSIRLQVLASLDSRFDPLLAQPSNLRCLFIALNDEVFEIRQTAMEMLGRLTLCNPSIVLPSLRQTLVQLLAELEYSGDTRGKEEGALLIGSLLRSASQLAKPYVIPILKALTKNLRKDSNLRFQKGRRSGTVSVSKAILATLGDLAVVGATDLAPYLNQLLPEILAEMHDSNNPQILQVAIKTFGQLVSSTGYVVAPYHEYPELLDLLCSALQKSGDANESLRVEAGRTIGILGALDPYNLRLFHLQKSGKLHVKGLKDPRFSSERGAPKMLSASGGRQFGNVGIRLGEKIVGNNSMTTITHPYMNNSTYSGIALASTGAQFSNASLDVMNVDSVPLLLVSRERNQSEDRDGSNNLIGSSKNAYQLEVPPDDLLPSTIEDPSQYFPTVAFNALIRILIEPRNSVHYQGAFVAIMYICKSQGKKIEPHLRLIIPAFLYTMEKVNHSLRKFLFEQLCDLVMIVEEKIQEYLDHVAMNTIIARYWEEHLEEVLNLVKRLATSLGEKFRVYLSDLMPQFLSVIRIERDAPHRPRTILVLKTVVSLGRLVDGYLHLVIPALVQLIQSSTADLNVRKSGLGSLGSLVKKLNMGVFSSKIIHMLSRVIATQPELVYLAMDCLCCMVYTLGDDYAIFVPIVSQVLGRQTSSVRNSDIFVRYDLLVSKILKYQPLPAASWATDPLKAKSQERTAALKDTSASGTGGNPASNGDLSSLGNVHTQDETTRSLPIDQKNLIKVWESSQRSTKEDWTEWMRVFSVELLRESPSPVLRSCKELASVYQPLAQELFNAAFVSAWAHLSPPTQDNLVRALETAFHSPHLPSEILQTLLSLAEFMEHDDQPLPIDIRLLGSLAEKSHSFAKALHYKEVEFNTNPTEDGIEALISINSKLNQPEAARGVLKYALARLPGIEVKASWYEKLLQWEDALAKYDDVLQDNPDDVESIFGKMRCLFAMGEWRRLNDHVQDTWSKIYGPDEKRNQGGSAHSKRKLRSRKFTRNEINQAGSMESYYDISNTTGSNGSQDDNDDNTEEKLLDVPPALKKELCSNGARVAFSLRHWDAIPKYINSDMDETEAHLFQAVVSIRKMELSEALESIEKCRKAMDPTLLSLVSESYARAYLPSVVNLQMLSELEEIVEYLRYFASANNGELTIMSTPTSGSTSRRRKMSISSMNFVSASGSKAVGLEKQQVLTKLQTVWTRRVLGVERNIKVWQNLMLVRSLVFDAKEDVDIWLKYARLCSRSGHLRIASSVLWRVGAQPLIRSIHTDPYAPLPISLSDDPTASALKSIAFRGGNTGLPNSFGNGTPSGAGSSSNHVLAGDGSVATDPRVVFSYLRHLWTENREDVALKQMHYFINVLEQQAADLAREGKELSEEMVNLRVQVYVQLGEWQMSLLEPRNHVSENEVVFEYVLSCLETATKLDPTNHRAWHDFALMNFRALDATMKETYGHPNSSLNDEDKTEVSSALQSAQAKKYAAPAVQGFFRSISCGYMSYDVTKDVLRLLTLWFAHGHLAEVHSSMMAGFQDVSIDTWLDVIPQLIARIDSPNAQMRELLHDLLCRIGFAHPQALIYPITVASKATNKKRKTAAEGILEDVQRHSSKLVSEASMVSRELIRVAILWNELWYGALEEACKHFFNKDIKSMIAELAPLHEQMEHVGKDEAPTLREVAFFQAFARDLNTAHAWSMRFEKTQNLDDLNQAWDIYYSVFSRIRKQLTNLNSLELANVGPKLLLVQNLSLAVPGTYEAGAPIVRISSFDTKVTVLTSKQRPRKVSIKGSDGRSYSFLLKGHEDLRQDERVMQLFGVINTLLANDNDTSKRNLAIERYSVLPLSHTSGLIGWVPNCDTLHQLIRDYREARKIQLNVEHRLMVQMAPDYDKLPLMQKVEAFKYALGETTGQDLYRVLWLKSRDSEVWLDRRRNFTRSLAVMSMAGYILGLGDRHPSNLMLDRMSGKLVHIDFGDCFEVAMERDKYPERVPFRLTRMLTQAMEVSGIEGNFRYTCEASMRVLRDNRDSLLAVLEAFVYDPLINWRLLKKDAVPSHAANAKNGNGVVNVNGVNNGPNHNGIRINHDSDSDSDHEDESAVLGGVDHLMNNGSLGSDVSERGSDSDPIMSDSGSDGTGNRTTKRGGSSRRRRANRNNSSSRRSGGDNSFGFNMDSLDAASLARNSIEEAQMDYDTKAIGQSAVGHMELPQLNEKALSVVERVKKKLAGRDFDDGDKVLSVDAQVDRLIQQATSHENLCQLYYGWCPFW